MIQPNNTSVSDLEFFKKTFPVADFKIDLFSLFYQLGSFILKNKGILCFISPSSLLNNVYARSLRNFLSVHHNILMIAVTKEKVFEEADVHTGIFLFEKVDFPDPHKMIKLTTELDNVVRKVAEFQMISQENFQGKIGDNWNLLIDSKNFSIFEKTKDLLRLGDISKINRGLISGDRDKYFSKSKMTEKHIKILTGSDINRYHFIEPQEYIWFERPKSAGGCWDREVHMAPFKLCIRQIGTEPTAAIVENPYAVTGNIFTVIHEEIAMLKYMLGIINSKFIKYFWKVNFYDFKTTFPQVTISSLASIPIKLDRPEITNKIILNIDLILKSRGNSDLRYQYGLEYQIDQLVYQLYNLTEEEIAIVENATAKNENLNGKAAM